jgi:hypothetical protein
MTHSRVAVSDDHVSLFLISGELTKQCLALGRIEMDRCFLGTGRSLVTMFREIGLAVCMLGEKPL